MRDKLINSILGYFAALAIVGALISAEIAAFDVSLVGEAAFEVVEAKP